MHRTAAFAAAALLTLATAIPAYAAGGEPGPPRGLFLTVSGSQNTWIRGVLLHCSPRPGGAHPDPVAACEALAAARGDLDRLPGNPHPCVKTFDPVTVEATGVWRGRPTAWHKTYANACELDAATGEVFDF
ncbi:protease inhibitor SIL-V5 [Streptomyces sp. ISL-1]|uniref:SSI family serine proteinase inhibitor n=1 Tax=Streptomyces sp. ISL-1 TaxID=2817657 RepID=UPI001BEA6F6B|nr:SSI family serine proteinase inhibitor [Streptomyces sp. ISL-1]MBT2388112.1 protease inhibitor SIL-V5 [Streptomyces sp. ISL-1]